MQGITTTFRLLVGLPVFGIYQKCKLYLFSAVWNKKLSTEKQKFIVVELIMKDYVLRNVRLFLRNLFQGSCLLMGLLRVCCFLRTSSTMCNAVIKSVLVTRLIKFLLRILSRSF